MLVVVVGPPWPVRAGKTPHRGSKPLARLRIWQGHLLEGLNPQGLGLGETAELYAFAQGLDAEELVDSAVSAAVDLIRHGFLIPTDLL